MKYIPTRVYVKMYNDMGYVYSRNPGNSFLNNKWLNGYGAGVDIVISYYLKLRLEYSFNHLGQNDLFLHSTKE
jgi:opacity protein-like surface antigen